MKIAGATVRVPDWYPKKVYECISSDDFEADFPEGTLYVVAEDSLCGGSKVEASFDEVHVGTWWPDGFAVIREVR